MEWVERDERVEKGGALNSTGWGRIKRQEKCGEVEEGDQGVR